MATISVNDYLQPLSEEAPCGENLEYDAAFAALERAAPGYQLTYGYELS